MPVDRVAVLDADAEDVCLATVRPDGVLLLRLAQGIHFRDSLNLTETEVAGLFRLLRTHFGRKKRMVTPLPEAIDEVVATPGAAEESTA